MKRERMTGPREVKGKGSSEEEDGGAEDHLQPMSGPSWASVA